jgi:hypothetical protein
MSITTTTLTRTAGVAGVVGGLLFLGVQIGHPPVDAAFATTAEFTIRQAVKIGFAVLSLVGITGVYLRQVRQTGVLGLLGYVLMSIAFLTIASIEVIGAVVLPVIADSNPAYVSDVLTVAMGGDSTGDVGPFTTLHTAGGLALVAGGLLFGIALFRARVLARWASALLALSVLATLAIPVLPQVNERLFAVPIGVALVGLGFSLWREQRSRATRAVRSADSPRLDPAGVK